MSIYISPNYVKKKSDYTSTDKVSIYINYYYKGKKLRIPSGVVIQFKDWNKRWKQGDKSNPILKSYKSYSTTQSFSVLPIRLASINSSDLTIS